MKIYRRIVFSSPSLPCLPTPRTPEGEPSSTSPRRLVASAVTEDNEKAGPSGTKSTWVTPGGTIQTVVQRSEALKGVRFSPLAAPKKHSCKEVITMADLLDNLIQLQEDEGWLTMWEVRAHLRLSHNAALRWIRMHVPLEYRGKRGNHRLVHIKGTGGSGAITV